MESVVGSSEGVTMIFYACLSFTFSATVSIVQKRWAGSSAILKPLDHEGGKVS